MLSSKYWGLFLAGGRAASENRSIGEEELPEVPHHETALVAAARLEQHWAEEVAAKAAASAKEGSKECAPPSLVSTVLSGYKYRIIGGWLIRHVRDAFNITALFLLRSLVDWIQETPPTPTYKGYILAAAIAVCCTVEQIIYACSSEVNASLCQEIRMGIHVMIWRKAQRLPTDHGQQGKIIAMHSTDASRLHELIFCHGLTCAPGVFTAAIVAMYIFIGPASLFTIPILLIILLFQGLLSNFLNGAIAAVHEHTDRRIQLIDEVLQGIRVCRFMHWEKKMIEDISEKRAIEMEAQLKMNRLRFTATGLGMAFILFLELGVFGGAHALGHEMKAGAVFATMASFGILYSAVFDAAIALSQLIPAVVAFHRISAFLAQKERVPYREDFPSSDSKVAIELSATPGYCREDGNAANSFVPLLPKIELKIPKGELVIVVGPTGSGKSVLVNALLGEACVQDPAKSCARHHGSVAFVAQEAWIMNASVRENILLGQPFDEARYAETVQACQLLSDFAQLPSGDRTEIGERGINVSGGQKQRIALARAVYSGRDIILMDDPLSAVDAHVCRAIFDECILRALKGKTRVLVTHQEQFLPFAAQVISLQNCTVRFVGTFEDYSSAYEVQTANTPTSSGRQSPTALASTTNLEGAAGSAVVRPEEPATSLMSAEKQNNGIIPFSVYLWYGKQGGIFNLLVCFLAFAVWRAAGLIVDMWLAMWSNKKGGFGRDSYTSNEYMMWFGICGAIALVTVVGRQAAFMVMVLRASQRAHDSMVQRILYATNAFFDTTPLGRVLNRFTKDVQGVDMILPELGVFVFSMSFLAVGYLIIMCISSVLLLILVVIMVYAYLFLLHRYTATVRQLKRMEDIARSPMVAILSESLGGLATIRSYNVEQMFDKIHAERADRMGRALYGLRATAFVSFMCVSHVAGLIVLSCCTLACVFMTVDAVKSLSPGSAVTSLAVCYCVSLSMELGLLVLVFGECDSVMNSVQRMKEYSEELPLERDVTYGTGPQDCHAPPPGWPLKGKLEFKNVELAYRPGLPLVLKGVSFCVEPGEKVGIVGRTGSGKSTIMLALFRMIELSAGRIELDDFSAAEVSLTDLRTSITIIPQDPLLFAGTVRSNLDPFRKHSDETLWETLTQVGLAKRVREDVSGLDGPVAPKGSNYSVGQRQLMCLARAMLRKTRYLLLDEATASVDFEADALIQRTVRTKFADCTVLTIAHRLATVIDCDRVIVMSGGSVAENASPADLITDYSSAFYSMVENLGPEAVKELTAIALSKKKAITLKP